MIDRQYNSLKFSKNFKPSLLFINRTIFLLYVLFRNMEQLFSYFCVFFDFFINCALFERIIKKFPKKYSLIEKS